MKKIEVILKSTQKFSNNTAEALRGYLGSYFKDIIEFHNHTSAYTFNYDFSFIQYKVIRGELAIIGIDKGVELLLEHIPKIKKIKIGDDFIDVTPEIKITFHDLKVEEKFYNYKFESPWLALNETNYKKYINGELSLNNQLRNNIIEFFKMCGTWADKEIKVEGTFIEEKIVKKDTTFLGFLGNFKVNVDLPDNISLGKRKSIGMGRIRKV
nr:CRISPR-associated endonuclease Cas6 [Fusobacterium gastrosuis]